MLRQTATLPDGGAIVRIDYDRDDHWATGRNGTWDYGELQVEAMPRYRGGTAILQPVSRRTGDTLNAGFSMPLTQLVELAEWVVANKEALHEATD